MTASAARPPSGHRALVPALVKCALDATASVKGLSSGDALGDSGRGGGVIGGDPKDGYCLRLVDITLGAAGEVAEGPEMHGKRGLWMYENQKGLSTGSNVWDAAIDLSAAMGKRVLELGAGTGLVGIVAGSLGVASVTMTDNAEELFPLIGSDNTELYRTEEAMPL
ncbi:hypothetical protein T484DRAFT_1761535 [Baffinella frigidus]|nr:hypothetical protein T484DRAFT_1761535 [Cryptophyta sp. CCMP2293]